MREDTERPLTLKEAVEQLVKEHPLGKRCRILCVSGEPDLYTVEEWLLKVETGSELERSVMERAVCSIPVRVEEKAFYALDGGQKLYEVLD